MLLEKYEFRDRESDNRTEDKYRFGYELYRSDVTGSNLVQLCIGGYGFISRYAAKENAERYVMFEPTLNTNRMFSLYVKIYEMDRNREVIPESIELNTIFMGEIMYNSGDETED